MLDLPLSATNNTLVILFGLVALAIILIVVSYIEDDLWWRRRK